MKNWEGTSRRIWRTVHTAMQSPPPKPHEPPRRSISPKRMIVHSKSNIRRPTLRSSVGEVRAGYGIQILSTCVWLTLYGGISGTGGQFVPWLPLSYPLFPQGVNHEYSNQVLSALPRIVWIISIDCIDAVFEMEVAHCHDQKWGQMDSSDGSGKKRHGIRGGLDVCVQKGHKSTTTVNSFLREYSNAAWGLVPFPGSCSGTPAFCVCQKERCFLNVLCRAGS